MNHHLPYEPTLIPRARRLRRAATFPERLLWSRLRRRQLGAKFLRQKPVGRYIVDFLCADVPLVIEVDGRSHDENAWAYDVARQQWLEGVGLTILRIQNDEVLSDVEGCVDRVRAAIEVLMENDHDFEDR